MMLGMQHNVSRRCRACTCCRRRALRRRLVQAHTQLLHNEPQHAPSPPPGALEHHMRPLPLSRRVTPTGQAAGGPCCPLVGRRSFTGSEQVPSVALAVTLDQEQREGRRTAASPSRPRRARPRRRRSSPRRRRAPPPPPWRGALLAVSRPATAAGLAGACAASMRHRRTMRGADGALPRRPTARPCSNTPLPFLPMWSDCAGTCRLLHGIPCLETRPSWPGSTRSARRPPSSRAPPASRRARQGRNICSAMLPRHQRTSNASCAAAGPRSHEPGAPCLSRNSPAGCSRTL